MSRFVQSLSKANVREWFESVAPTDLHYLDSHYERFMNRQATESGVDLVIGETIRQMAASGQVLLGRNLSIEVTVHKKVAGIKIAPPWEPFESMA